jgi:hypothetical protein
MEKNLATLSMAAATMLIKLVNLSYDQLCFHQACFTAATSVINKANAWIKFSPHLIRKKFKIKILFRIPNFYELSNSSRNFSHYLLLLVGKNSPSLTDSKNIFEL